jgi:HD-like signal output (HDOD) protein
MATMITDEAADKLLSTIKIPPRPAVIDEINREKKKDDPDLRKIAQIISKDMALTAAMLKTANSPFFGLRTKVETVNQAVMTMGLNNALGIVTGIALKNALAVKEPTLERFWDNAEKVANVATYLSGKVPGVPKELAYMYGLFRDCGIPIMMQKFPEYAKTLLKANTGSKLAFTSLEEEAHATNHATIGYLLAKSWSLPNSISQAVLNHHEISILHSNENFSAEVRGLIAVIRFAEFLCDSRQMRDDHDWETSGPIVLSYLGISDDEFNDIKDEVLQYQEV